MNIPAELAQAEALHEAGHLAQAEARYVAILAAEPLQATALRRMGTLRLQQGRVEEAMALTRAALAEEPGNPEAHADLGTAYNLLERPADALASYEAALGADPDYAEAWYGQGLALHKLKRYDEAAACLERALSIDPDYAEASCALGAALTALQRHKRAFESYRRALEVDPGYVEALLGMAEVLHAEKREAEAVGLYRQAAARRPGHAPTLVAMALALQADGALAEALDRLREAAALAPQDAATQLHLGTALEEAGHIEESVRAFERAVALAPRELHGIFALAGARRLREGDPLLATLHELAAGVDALGEDERILLHFALAKALGDAGRPQEGFRELRDGNALKRRTLAYDEAATLATLARVPSVFTREFLAARAGSGDPSARPIFIVGMPRSGSTLVEHMLASHGAVFGGGERGDFSEAMKAGGLDPASPQFLEQCAGADGASLARIGADYVARLGAGAARAGLAEAERITDKMLANYCFAGLIHLALPNARIVHTRRDPIDNCLSCYSKLFASDIPYAYDLAEFGRYYRAYAALMDHWRALLPAAVMIEVQYEQVVADFEREARRIVAHCGLPWDPACLKYYETRRPVRTASVAQVRQPIYSSSVGRWRPGGDELRPLLDALGVAPGAAPGRQ